MAQTGLPSGSFYAKDRKSWRKWLEINHEKLSQVWLVLYRKASPEPL
jgi:hypothetical protein